MEIRKSRSDIKEEIISGALDVYLSLPGHKEEFAVFKEDLRKIREERENRFASTKDKSLRMGISMPENMMAFLERVLKKRYGEKLFEKEHPETGMNWFMKKFPEFTIPQEV